MIMKNRSVSREPKPYLKVQMQGQLQARCRARARHRAADAEDYRAPFSQNSENVCDCSFHLFVCLTAFV